MGNEEQSSHGKSRFILITRFMKDCVRGIIFLTIGVLIFLMLQSVFIPKRFPYMKTYDAGKLTAYYTEEENSIDVLICATSHASKGILPMEIYEKYGIKSYNLSTSIQPIEATYYMLVEALKTQTPKVFIYDVSNLYIESAEKYYWLYVLAEMHMGKNKLALAGEYRNKVENCQESTKELLLPLLGYHTRWKELTKQDFTWLFSDKHYFGKGGQINSAVSPAEISVEEMNAVEDSLLRNTQKLEYIYDKGASYANLDESILYEFDIPENNIDWLKKIAELCEQNGIELLAIKVPTIDLPQEYRSAWTAEKYRTVKALCEEYGISYYDLLYDTDVNIDWSNDTTDKGQHLNLSGGRKVSIDLGEYLREHYGLAEERNEQWDMDLVSYQKVRKVALLQLERDFSAYIDMLANDYKDKVIFLSVAGDMSAGLTENEVSALRALGLQADFSNALRQSYVAVIENGQRKYEALSNRQLTYEDECDRTGTAYEVYSSGWWTSPRATIRVSGSEYACNHEEGLNIVVYDEERDLVIDSVAFVFGTENGYTAERQISKTNDLEIAFEKYIMEKENK